MWIKTKDKNQEQDANGYIGNYSIEIVHEFNNDVIQEIKSRILGENLALCPMESKLIQRSSKITV